MPNPLNEFVVNVVSLAVHVSRKRAAAGLEKGKSASGGRNLLEVILSAR